MSTLNKQSKLNILNLSIEKKALRYLNLTKQIKQLNDVKALLKDELTPILKKCPNQLKNFKGVPKPSVFDKNATVDFYLELIERVSNRFDTTAFKKAEPKLYTKYLKASPSTELKGKILS